MARIDEIRQAILAKEQHEDEVRRWGANVAIQLGEGFREYLGLPSSYQTIDGLSKPYLEYFKVDPDSEEIDTKAAHIFDALLISYDGLTQFGLGTVLDRGERVFPKTRYLFLVEFRKVRQSLEVSIGRRPVVACQPIDNPVGFDLTPAFEVLFNIIMERLSSRVGDDRQQKQVGFDTRPA